ncbi:MAG: three-Cys-motif partner protein TcmP [Ignavibacteriaceae bacterium]
MKKNFDPILPVEDDGLPIPEVGIWSLEKYQLLGGYCDIFTKGMRGKWGKLVYLDLFAGAGYSRIRENNNIIKSSSLISVSLPNKFDKYIFCEENNKLFLALNERLRRENKKVNAEIFEGDCNQRITEIKESIPKYSKDNTVLTFCFLDPFNLNIKFSTVKSLADNLVDFLVLQALHMDANRNFKIYVNENSETISNYLEIENWRKEWENSKLLPKDFVKFLADQYDTKMKELGYLTAIRHQIKYPDKNVPLYYLTFYSKHKRGLDFFNKVNQYSTNQLGLGI